MSCSDALEAYARRSFSGWTGLPDGCTLEDLRSAGGSVDEDPVAGRIGSPVRQVLFHAVALGESAGPERAWVQDGTVILLDSELPTVPGGPAALVEALGEPAVRRDARWDVITLHSGEWVWPGRGLAALVRGDGEGVLRLMAFAPAPLELYDSSLRPGFGVREFRES